jgi:hypothetical protein
VFELNRRYTERTLAVIKEGIAAGEFEERLPLRLVRDMIFGCAEHHTWAYLRGEGQFSPEDAADALTNLIYRSLACAPRAAPAPVDASVQRLEQAVRRLEDLAPARRRARPVAR